MSRRRSNTSVPAGSRPKAPAIRLRDKNNAASENDLVRIFEATRAIGSTCASPGSWKTVTRLATKVVRAETGSILLVDPATGNSS